MAPDAVDRKALAALRDDLGDDAVLAEILGAFLGEAPKLLQQAQDALRVGDAEGFTRAAHTLKSTAAQLGAPRLSGRAKELEEVGRAANLEAAGALMPELERALDEAVAALGAERTRLEGGR